MRIQRKWIPWIIMAIGVPACLAVSYVFALAGEPQSLWFWRDILGVMQ